MTTIRKRLIEITAGMSDEPALTIEQLESFVMERENDAIKTYILTGRASSGPETTPERMDGE